MFVRDGTLVRSSVNAPDALETAAAIGRPEKSPSQVSQLAPRAIGPSGSLGTYTTTFKDRAATMSPEKGDNRSFWIADVPYTQYFNPPFALHASYWHERFGEPTSAGCVNLSPLDAQTMFEWSDPQVPGRHFVDPLTQWFKRF